MATERLPMHHLREILRQKLALGRSHRQVARSVGVSPSTVAGVFADARSHGLDAAAVEALTDAELEARMYPKAPLTCLRAEPDCAALHLEMRRPGVTLALLHVEFLTAHPDGVRYTAFCDRYRAWQKRQSPVMRQVHVAGDKLFVDYAGMRPRLVDPQTGEIIDVELFVAVLGASNYTYAEATRTQQVPDFVASVSRALTFIGGVPQGDRARPTQERGDHRVSLRPRRAAHDRRAGALLRDHDPARAPEVPARQGKGRSRRADRRALAARTHPQRDVREPGRAQRAARRADADLNDRLMRTYKASRRELFERLDKARAHAAARRAVRGVHVEEGRAQHRLPPRVRPPLLLGAVRAAPRGHPAVGTRDGEHRGGLPRARPRRRPRPQLRPRRLHHEAEHMPSSHRAQAEWTPSRILGWAEQVGPNARALCEVILRERQHPEWGFRSCLGLCSGSRRSTATSASTRPAGARSTPARAATAPS